ncbi:MAG: hypothetical protein ABJH13_04375, partial [Roseobacter sp.]
MNNRTENTHLPFRKRERAMQGFRSSDGLQRFVAVHSAVRNCFSATSRRRSASTTVTIEWKSIVTLTSLRLIAPLFGRSRWRCSPQPSATGATGFRLKSSVTQFGSIAV